MGIWDSISSIGEKIGGAVNSIGNKGWDTINAVGEKGLQIAHEVVKNPVVMGVLASNPELGAFATGALTLGDGLLGASKLAKNFLDGNTRPKQPVVGGQPALIGGIANPFNVGGGNVTGSIQKGGGRSDRRHRGRRGENIGGATQTLPISIVATGPARTPPLRHQRPRHTNTGANVSARSSRR